VNSQEPETVGVEELSQILGIATSTIRHAMVNKASWLPPHFKLGRQWKFRRVDITTHLEKLANNEIKPIRQGRPRTRT
jgi:predicted DNA-binding transcriptional regulator AlpA